MLEDDVGSLYEYYYNDLYRYVYIMTLNSFDTEDILQNVLVKVIKGRKSFRGESSIKTWLFAIAHNECLTFLAKDKRKILVEYADNIRITLGCGADEILLQKETVKILLNFIQEQEEPIKSLLILRLIEEKSFVEIGRILNKPDGWCQVNFFRMKKKMIDLLDNKKEMKEKPYEK